jgi:hypothetical protein
VTAFLKEAENLRLLENRVYLYQVVSDNHFQEESRRIHSASRASNRSIDAELLILRNLLRNSNTELRTCGDYVIRWSCAFGDGSNPRITVGTRE